MSMPDRQVWVIKNQDGYFINPQHLTRCTGITTGFKFYNNEETAKRKLELLGKEYHSEYINLMDIPNGEMIYEND